MATEFLKREPAKESGEKISGGPDMRTKIGKATAARAERVAATERILAELATSKMEYEAKEVAKRKANGPKTGVLEVTTGIVYLGNFVPASGKTAHELLVDKAQLNPADCRGFAINADGVLTYNSTTLNYDGASDNDNAVGKGENWFGKTPTPNTERGKSDIYFYVEAGLDNAVNVV